MQILSNPISALKMYANREIFAPFRKSESRNMMVTSDFRPEVEIPLFRVCAMKNMQYNPYLWPKELRLPADHEDLSLLSDLTHVSSFLSSPLSHPLLLLSSTPGPKLIFSIDLFLNSFFYLSIHRTDSMDSSCFSFFSDLSVLTLALWLG